MAKLPSLEHVKYVRAKGKTYAYFNTGKKRDGKPIYARLPDPASVGFYDSYAAMVGARNRRMSIEYTVAELCREYEYSLDFSRNATNTQILYSKTLRRISEHLGEFPVNSLESTHIQDVLDNEMSGPGAHNVFLGVLSAMYAWARAPGRKKTDREPTKGIARMKIEPHKPWPSHVLEAALASDDDRIRLAVSLLYFTGQRIGDVLKMRWSDIDDGVIHVVQQKTGKELWIPLIGELAKELSATPKRGMFILCEDSGLPIKYDHARRDLQAFTAAMGCKSVPHGLRKNAVIALLEAGCSVAEVAAITGQTYKIVENYAKQINQKKMAKAAVHRLENKRRTGKHIGKRND